MPDEYRRFWITSRDAIERERLLADAFEAGAEGAEEVEGSGVYRACVYATSFLTESLRSLLRAAASDDTEIGESEALPHVDWREAWKQGIEALRISDRLVIRPSFVGFDLEPGQHEVVIDPGQAFGTGGHASTRLCLEWIDALYADSANRGRFDRLLDAGTGSGVLALAAVLLGARSAVGFDLDPLAIEAAVQAARQNGLADRVRFFTGPIEASREEVDTAGGFPLVVANLLKRELLPIVKALARRVGPSGRVVLAGLLEEDGPEVLDRFGAEGFVEVEARRTLDDATGTWIGLCLGRSCQSRRSFESQSA